MDPQELHNMLGALVSNCPELGKSMRDMGQPAHVNYRNGRKCRTYTSNIKNQT